MTSLRDRSADIEDPDGMNYWQVTRQLSGTSWRVTRARRTSRQNDTDDKHVSVLHGADGVSKRAPPNAIQQRAAVA